MRKLGSSLDSTLVSLLQEDGEDRQYNFTPLVSKIVNHVIAHSIYGIEPEEEFVKNCSKLFQVNNPQSIMSIMPCKRFLQFLIFLSLFRHLI